MKKTRASKKTAIVIRADASVRTGTGHVMRCLALTQALANAGKNVVLAMAECPEALTRKIKSSGMSTQKIKSRPGSLKDAEETAKFAARKNATWVVVDGYIFSDKYQDALKKAGLRLLFIDDFGHCPSYPSDIILNQNLYAGTHFYPETAPFTRILLGTQYVLLRNEFSPYSNWRRQVPEKASKLLVTLGGSDPDNTTLKIIRGIKASKLGLEVKIVAGGANPHLKSLEKEIKKSPNLQILKNVSNMPELMAWADIVITSGGSTCWETCFMGLPNIIIYCADNQKPIALSLDEAGAAINLGQNSELVEKKFISTLKSLANDFEARSRMSEKGRLLVDGRGADRIIYAMGGLFLRKASKDDCKFIWELSNSKPVRDVSFTRDPIPWDHHKGWFDRTLADKNCFFCIAETAGGKPAGQVRFRMNGPDAVISTSLALEFRGKGYGSILIFEASNALFSSTGVKTVHAYIKNENKGSLKSFQKAGFRQTDLDRFALEKESLHLIMEKPAE
ncbi:MAG TPA: UDP-2,4-diacetamido-2,4,6-trideoxy-beta-L-altropyranose hydrolase [Lentisphaeria bacterium]|nr:MAG: UDP-2,4-diacetamido-2,4,6-trideoxy-beta-L-altropyranose hydrolase [Lentisphaerae bacterium GWF2_49_21]HBC87164.1 UDP-2,4-diacetamido-2,4,6-trideoxy-beta-L-altropyranose hydrolase [Lentisphaeria bacterium]